MNLENDLRRALHRESPEAGFAGRVMQRIVEDGQACLSEESRLRPGQARSPLLHWWRAAAASITLAAVIGGYAAHQIHERREGERAKEQVLRALTIAGEKVRYARQEVHEIGSH